MTTPERIVTAQKVIDADAATIFEAIADPAQQPAWDGNDNLKYANTGQRITGADQSFTMELTNGQSRINYIQDFEEGRLISWKPAPTGEEPRGHVWIWELIPQEPAPNGSGRTLVRHTYDWTRLTDPTRFERAQQNTPEALMASINRLDEYLRA